MAVKEEIAELTNKKLTRREFLKASGKGVAGITVSSTLLSLIGCKTGSDVKLWAIPTGVLVAERARCTGCQRCEQACTLFNQAKGSAYVARVRQRPNYFFGDEGVGSGGGLYYDLNFTPITCRQCKDPACGNACPVQAISADPRFGNARTIDESKCIGCGACAAACPWNVPVVDLETRKSTKCITCGECARNCPTGALRVIPWEEITV
jgi:Fe-S-cluster-containing dehydrogenase component